MNALQSAQIQFDGRLPPPVSETPQELARGEWLHNAVEQLVCFGADVKFRRRLRSSQGVTQQQFTLAVDEHVSNRLDDCQIDSSALGSLVIAAWQRRIADQACAIELLGHSNHPFGMLGEIAGALLEPLANDALIAQVEDDLL